MGGGFWSDKRVLITGHTGFKGTWLALWLKRLGADVAGYALEAPTRPSLFELVRADQGIRSIIGDVRDFGALRKAVAECQPHIVFHLAAQAVVRTSYDEPVETFSTNVMGTVHLLEAVRREGENVRCLVNVTTDKVYENDGCDGGYGENDPLGGYDPYSASKGCSELVTASFRRSFFLPANVNQRAVAVASARAGNVIGGGDWTRDRLVPDCIGAWEAGRPIVIRNPQAVRPWQYVLEPLSGYLLLAQKLFEKGPCFTEAWNFGPGPEGEQAVRVVVEKLSALWGAGASWSADKGHHPHEAPCLRLDCSKASHRLGWRPRTSLDEALARTVQWHKRVAAGDGPRQVTLDHIELFDS